MYVNKPEVKCYGEIDLNHRLLHRSTDAHLTPVSASLEAFLSAPSMATNSVIRNISSCLQI